MAVRSTLARRRRLAGTVLAVMLGVAFLTGTLVFTDTIGRTFDDLFESIYADTDSYVRASASVETQMGPSQRGRIDEGLVDTVAQVPGVAEAKGVVSGYAQIVGSDGKAIGDPGRGAPTFAMNYASGALTPWQLLPGSRAPGSGELVIDKGSADAGRLELGDRVTVLTQTGPHEMPLVGIARFGSVDSPGGASVAVMDLRTAQELLIGGRREVDAVMVDAEPGVSEDTVTARIDAAVPKGIEVLTGSEITAENQEVLQEGLGFFNTFLLVFAAIGFIVACFTIYNTFQIIVSQRVREMALLRSVGATRRQVLSAQLLEAVIIGTVAAAVGLVAGIAVASGMKAMMEAFGIDLPAGGTVFVWRTAAVAFAVGILVTVASAVIPSVRASKVPPLAAVRSIDQDAGDAAAMRRRTLIGSVTLVIGIAAFAEGLLRGGLAWVGFGALATFLGVFTLGPLLARPVAEVLGFPVARFVGLTGVLARENAVRNPGRTARTGGALMVGVALVAAITIIAATAKDWTHDTFDRQFSGDYVVSTSSLGMGGLPPDVADEIGALREVDVATGIRTGVAHVSGGGDTTYVAVDPATAGDLFDPGMVTGSVARLTAKGVLLDDDVARRRGLHVGDALTVRFVDGRDRTLEVDGIYTEDALAGPYVISQELHEQTGVDQFDIAVYVGAAAGVSDQQLEAAIEPITDRLPNATLESRAEYIADQAAQVDQILNLMYGLLGLAVVIALLSIANSISLSIHERTRELGLLRAVGMTRHQVGSTVRWEAGIVATLGAALGIVLGLWFGWATSAALRNEGLLAVTVPVPSLAVIVIVGIAGGVLASLRPAWRGAHLDVLPAIADE